MTSRSLCRFELHGKVDVLGHLHSRVTKGKEQMLLLEHPVVLFLLCYFTEHSEAECLVYNISKCGMLCCSSCPLTLLKWDWYFAAFINAEDQSFLCLAALFAPQRDSQLLHVQQCMLSCTNVVGKCCGCWFLVLIKKKKRSVPLVRFTTHCFCLSFPVSGSWQKRREPLRTCETLEGLTAASWDLHFSLQLLDNCLTIARDCRSVPFNAITNKSLFLRWSFGSVSVVIPITCICK